ncbi:MAG: hypothetical protein NC453_20120 [Muribaculum sp.]|nr:hypothetical protein [Muribaculum sp.]
MNLLSLSIIYAIGIIGYCGFTYLGWRMWLNRTIWLDSVNWKITVPIGLIALPILFVCMYMTSLDALLWANREMSLNIACLADMYGPANEILR